MSNGDSDEPCRYIPSYLDLFTCEVDLNLSWAYMSEGTLTEGLPVVMGKRGIMSFTSGIQETTSQKMKEKRNRGTKRILGSREHMFFFILGNKGKC